MVQVEATKAKVGGIKRRRGGLFDFFEISDSY